MEKDEVQIRCLSDSRRYADLINGVVFKGRQVVNGDDIQERDSQTGLWKSVRGKRSVGKGKKYRDLIRKVAMGVNFTVIGIENQKMREYVDNYHIHLLEIRKLQDTDVFQTDLKQIFDFIRNSNDKEKLR